MRVSESQDFGAVTMRIEEVLKEKGISKNQICKDLDLPRGNFNRYCRNNFQRIDAALLCKLCWYLEVDLNDLLVYQRPQE
ncbi:MAG: helix-turn-helix transcriptional regulator [Clostridiales bacterium]|nr:helix-turn-helix transcriptional regulator [Clostridiales bacterium]MDY3762850.1 helix-turn-helix transcriptional regulator [Candidatus Ventricola sp.]MCI6587270.1 helix-turn-helix transcriptional regulator [Clostridiales bacterium]MCI7704573.1 helix-turn-helix transcriptional regulator [Clostridiales bacterium]MDY3833172.1 helix-turn-helix transcriptional regulator [Candidatus Ventricola sp.]